MKLEPRDFNRVRFRNVDKRIKYNNKFELDLSGASEFFGDINSEKVILNELGDSNIESELILDSFEIDLSGASKLLANWESEEGKIKLGGSSDIDMKRLEAKKLFVDIFGSSKVVIEVTERISVSVSGSSSINVYGNPIVDESGLSGDSDLDLK